MYVLPKISMISELEDLGGDPCITIRDKRQIEEARENVPQTIKIYNDYYEGLNTNMNSIYKRDKIINGRYSYISQKTESQEDNQFTNTSASYNRESNQNKVNNTKMSVLKWNSSSSRWELADLEKKHDLIAYLDWDCDHPGVPTGCMWQVK
eukprot:UN29121